jgi:hypothetical protein
MWRICLLCGGAVPYSSIRVPVILVSESKGVSSFGVSFPRIGFPRTLAASVCALLLLPAGSTPSHAQWYGWEKPRPQARVLQSTRYASRSRSERGERRTATVEKTEPKKKKVEAPELPQMAFAVVSLADQRISIYGADGLLTRSVVSTGQAGHRTPTGIFTILEKQRWHQSNIYSGAPMPFMQRVTWSGIAMHEGIVPGYPASHGCIRLPAAFAAKLWTMTKPGTRVIIAASDLQPFEFAHPLLPVPRMVPASLFAADQQPLPQRVAVASNDDAAGTALAAAAAGETEAAAPRQLSPFEVAYALKAKAAADLSQARKAAEAALAASRVASQEADAAADELRSAKAELDRARAKLESARAAAAEDAAKVATNTAEPAKSEPNAAPSPSPVAVAEDALKAAEARFAAAKADDDAKSPRAYELASAARAAQKAIDAAEDSASDARRRQLPVNVVVSRKEGMILVRQGFKAVYEAPVTIAEPEKPLGTHIMIAIEASGDASGLDWAAITVPTTSDDGERKTKPKKGRGEPVAEAPRLEPSGIEEALERITMPESAKTAIAELMWVGGSLVITDRGLSNESGEHTDLNVSLP